MHEQAGGLDEWGGVGMLACPACLILLEVDGLPEHPYLICRECGMVRLSG